MTAQPSCAPPSLPSPSAALCQDATYARSYRGEPCGDVALECAYPAAGDIGPDGCPGNGILSCRIAPGGSRVWYAGP